MSETTSIKVNLAKVLTGDLKQQASAIIAL